MRHVAVVWLSLIVGTLFVPSVGLSEPRRPKKVLFVCTGNFYRSRFAEAVFNEAAPKAWTASSRGLDAGKPRKTPVSPLVVDELKRRHVAERRVAGKPQQLTRADLDAADVVVLLDGAEHQPMLVQQFPGLPLDKVRSWSVADVPKLAPPDAFEAIAQQTASLIEELAGKRP